jgi:predicted dehydrogenase
MAPVRLALIGVGTIGGRHLQLMQDEPDCEVAALADPSSSAQARA